MTGFGDGVRAVVVGASGGIGGALTQALAARADVAEVIGLSRSGRVPEGRGIVAGPPMDITDEDSVAAAWEWVARGPAPRLVIVASGVLSDGAGLQPEKSFRQQSLAAFGKVFAVNTFGPALVARHALGLMPREGRGVFAALSARVGSISDNRLGGWHAYRASKAALNMLLKNYALEQARRNPDFVVAGLHPGTVDTGLSQPFRSGAKRVFSPAESAGYLLGVLERLTPADSGQVFDWAGERVPA